MVEITLDDPDELASLSMEALFERLNTISTRSTVLLEIARRYSRARKYPKAAEFAAQAIAASPRNFWAWVYYGNIEYARRRYNDALMRFRHAARIDSENAVPYWCMGDTFRDMNRFDEADAHYRRAVDIEPLCEFTRRQYHQWLRFRRRNA